MKRLLLLIALLAITLPVWAASLHDTSLGSDSGVTEVSTEALAVTTGDLVWVHVKWETQAATVTVDTGASTPQFSVANAEYEAAGWNGQTFYWTATSTGNVTPRAVFSASADFVTVRAISVTPAASTVLELGNVSAADGSAAAMSAGSASATAAGVAFTGFALFGSVTFTPGTGWAEPAEFDVSAAAAAQYQLQSGAGSLTGDGTASAAQDWIAQLAIFNEAPSGISLIQEGFRWGVDDGNEAGHTFEAAQDTNITIADNQSRLLRVLIDTTGDTASVAYTLRYQKNGSGGYVAVPVGATTPGSISNQLVAASADDAQQIGTTMTLTGTTIGGSLDATTDWAAMRFTNIAIPAGATITSAAVGVVPSGTGEDEPLVTVFLEAADDCATFTTGASDISNRSRTTGVAWSNTNLAASGATYHDTPSLVTDVQAVIDRAGWASGNDLCVIIQGGATATRDLTIEAQDLGPNTNPPRISIGWTTPNEVYIATSANIAAGGEATTARLTAPSGKTTSDFVCTTNCRWDDENGTDTTDITTDDYTELEPNVFIASSAAPGDFFDFRYYAGSIALDNYAPGGTDRTARWTIPGGGGGSPVPKILQQHAANDDEYQQRLVANAR